MARTGLFYFLGNFSYIPNESCLLYFDFKNLGGYPINNIAKSSYSSGFRLNVVSGSSLITGPFSHNGYFRSSAGPGSALRRILGVQTNTGDGWLAGFRTGIDYNQGFGFVCVASGAKGVIFSNFETGISNGSVLYKGFTFGINDANKLFFENRDDKGINCYSLTEPLSENNSILVSYSNGSITLGKYDYFSNAPVTESYFLDKPLLDGSINWTIGGITGAPDFFHKNMFGNGYIDAFLFFDQYVDATNFRYISSGLVCEPFLTGQLSGFIASNETTGFTTGLVPLSSGITGYNISATGQITDSFGNTYTGYTSEPLYKTESGSGLIFLTGEVFYPVFSGETRFELNFDSNFLKTFGMSKGASLYTLDTGNVYSWNFEKNSGEILSTVDFGKDYSLSYDRINDGFFIGDKSDFIFYLNGLMQNSGEAYLTGDPYNLFTVQERDYYVSGGYIFSTGEYNINDSSQVDFIKYESFSTLDNFVHLAGTGDRFIATGINNLVFFNGQKIHTGNLSSLSFDLNQIQVDSNSMFFSNCCDLFNGEKGVLTIIKNISGSFGELNSVEGYFNSPASRFKDGSLVCYLNGVKMEKNVDFFEGCSQDLFSSFGSFSGFKGVLYNNNSSFFEN